MQGFLTNLLWLLMGCPKSALSQTPTSPADGQPQRCEHDITCGGSCRARSHGSGLSSSPSRVWGWKTPLSGRRLGTTEGPHRGLGSKRGFST